MVNNITQEAHLGLPVVQLERKLLYVRVTLLLNKKVVAEKAG
jgi:hypothetical protein